MFTLGVIQVIEFFYHSHFLYRWAVMKIRGFDRIACSTVVKQKITPRGKAFFERFACILRIMV